MTYDLELSDDGDILVDPVGDYSTIDDDENVLQQIELGIADALGTADQQRLRAKSTYEIREIVSQALEDNPYVDDIVSIAVSQPNDEAVQISANTRSQTLEFTV